MITKSQLEYLVAVDRFGSFSKAANQCFVTQPTLSMQIQKLEAVLDVRLFDRSRKPVQATAIGKKVIDRAYHALREFERIAEVVHEQRETVSGELRLGIIPTLGPYLLPHFIPDLLTAHPNLRIMVEEVLTADMVDALRKNALDMGIAVTPLNKKEIIETPLFLEPFYGFLSKGHRLEKKTRLKRSDVASDELIELDSIHCLHGQVEALCTGSAPEKTARLRFVGGSIEGVIRMVMSGFGAAILPELATRTLPPEALSRLRLFETPMPARQVSLITHGAGIKTRLHAIIKQLIRSNIPEDLKDGVDIIGVKVQL